MMKQIEGHVPKEYQQPINGCIAAAGFLCLFYIAYLFFQQFATIGLSDMSDVPFFGQYMSNIFSTVYTLMNIHIGFVTAGLICICIAQTQRKPTFALVGGIIYVASILCMVGNWIFLFAIIALTFIGYSQMKNQE